MVSAPRVSASLHFKDPDVVLTFDIHTARWLQGICDSPIAGESHDDREKRILLYHALDSATSDVPDF